MKRYENLFEGYGNPEPATEKAEKGADKVHARKVTIPSDKLSILRSKPEFKEFVSQGRIKIKGNEVWFWNNDYEAKALTNVTASA